MEFIGSAVGSAIGLTVGLGVPLVVVPAALHVVGFTKAGIAAGSLAARLMSLTAIANGGRVAAGSLVAIGQSLGAGGLPMMAKTLFTTIGTILGTIIGAVMA